MTRSLTITLALLGLFGTMQTADAQPLGTFNWQLQPYCNVLSLVVSQSGSVYTLDGFDDQCGAATRAPATGVAVPNPNGTLEIGINIIVSPGAAPIHVEVPMSVATLGGTWRDSAGGTGAFTFTPGAGAGGNPRPVPGQPATFPNTFSLSPNGSFAAIRGPQDDPIPATGIGSRMMWHGAKSAFRAGRVHQTQWDEGNVGFYSAAFGFNTVASGTGSFAAGTSSGASGDNSFAAGNNAVAEGDGSFAAGTQTLAQGNNSVVLGSYARSLVLGAFVFGDFSTATPVLAPAANSFTVRSAGGVKFFTNSAMTIGVVLDANDGSWGVISDVNMKERFHDLDGDGVLAKLAGMPIREWSYKTQGAAVRHVGPTAQDFHAAFGLGTSELRISTVDADGIALRAIQALEARTREANETLWRENEMLKSELTALRERLEQIDRLLLEKR